MKPFFIKNYDSSKTVENGLDQNGNEQSIQQVKKELSVEKKVKPHEVLEDMSIRKFKIKLDRYIAIAKAIKKKMINGIHYVEIDGAEKPIITKQGTAWLAATTGMTTTIKESKEVIDFEKEYVFYQHEATASWGNRKVSAFGSCNSKEYNQKSKYTGALSKKDVYDVMNDVLQMSQKRARNQAIKELIAMTDIFETNEQDPKASRRAQMAIYNTFFKYYLKYAPNAPKKQKNKRTGKIKLLTEKEKLNWQKEWLKAKYFTPMIYELEIGTYGTWTVNEVDRLRKEIVKKSNFSKADKEALEMRGKKKNDN